jgi:hypothetical protein
MVRVSPYFLDVGGAGDEARKIADGIVTEVRSAGFPTALMVAVVTKGMAFFESDPARALDAYEEAISIARESGNRLWEMLITPTLAAAQARCGDPTTGLRSFLQMLDSWHKVNDIMFVANGIGILALLFEGLGDAMAVATTSGFLTKTFETNNFLRDLPDAIARVRQVLGAAEFEQARKRGAAMTYREVVDYAADRVQHALTALGAGGADRP